MSDPKLIEDQITKSVNSLNARYCDVRYQNITKTKIEIQGDEIKRSDLIVDGGGIARVLNKGGFGVSVFNKLTDLKDSLKKSLYFSNKMVGKRIVLKEADVVRDMIRLKIKESFLTIPLSEKVKLLKTYNEILLKTFDKTISSRIHYSDSLVTSYFVSSEGSLIYEETPDIALSFLSVARDGNIIQTAHDGVAGAKGFEIVRGLELMAHKVAEKARSLLKAKPIKGGYYNVILDPTLAGTFAHEAFGHLSESDFVYQNPKLKKIMKIGKKLGNNILNIIDDGSIENLRATHKYDDEGVRTRKNYLVKSGKLSGRLHSRITASIMNENLSGNARAVSYKYEPIVRMTNTYIDAGNSNLEDMTKELRNGVIAYDFFGGNTAFELFTFSSAYAYMVRNGKIEEMVRDVVLSGNLFETLKNIVGISDKVVWNETGGCGKGEQSGLPTPTGAPYVMVNKVMIGGE